MIWTPERPSNVITVRKSTDFPRLRAAFRGAVGGLAALAGCAGVAVVYYVGIGLAGAEWRNGAIMAIVLAAATIGAYVSVSNENRLCIERRKSVASVLRLADSANHRTRFAPATRKG